MRIFVIVDSSKRKAKPIGALFWEASDENEQGRFLLELSSDCNEDSLPLSLSFCVAREYRRATPEESADWVHSRIVPEDRHNIAEVLEANGLAEYNQVGLLAACKGRSSDDDLLAYEVVLPESWASEFGSRSLERQNVEEKPGARAILTADTIIAAVERQRVGAEISYAFVGLVESTDENGRSFTHAVRSRQAGTFPTSAKRIGTLIRNERKKQGLTQKQLAARAGITQTVMSRVESGTGNPTLSLLEELASALGAQLDITLT